MVMVQTTNGIYDMSCTVVDVWPSPSSSLFDGPCALQCTSRLRMKVV
jgi:hypothetical protein